MKLAKKPRSRPSRPNGRNVEHAERGERHDDEVPEGDRRPAQLVGDPAADGRYQRADQGAEEGVLQRVDIRGTAT